MLEIARYNNKSYSKFFIPHTGTLSGFIAFLAVKSFKKLIKIFFVFRWFCDRTLILFKRLNDGNYRVMIWG